MKTALFASLPKILIKNDQQTCNSQLKAKSFDFHFDCRMPTNKPNLIFALDWTKNMEKKTHRTHRFGKQNCEKSTNQNSGITATLPNDEMNALTHKQREFSG